MFRFFAALDRIDPVKYFGPRLINKPHLTNCLATLAHRRFVRDLYLFYKYFYDLCSDEQTTIIPPLATHNRTTRETSNIHGLAVPVQKPRTDNFSKSYVPRVSDLSNFLPESVFPESLLIFRIRPLRDVKINSCFPIPEN